VKGVGVARLVGVPVPDQRIFIDFAVTIGTPVHAARGGTVVKLQKVPISGSTPTSYCSKTRHRTQHKVFPLELENIKRSFVMPKNGAGVQIGCSISIITIMMV